MDFGESLVGIRQGKGISRKDFAEQLQIPYTTLRNYETGQREPGHKLLIKMAAILHVSVDELIGYKPQSKKTSPYSDKALKLAKDFDRLDGHGQRMLRLVADEELSRCVEQAKPKIDIDAEVESYRVELELQEEVAEKSSASDGLNDAGGVKMA